MSLPGFKGTKLVEIPFLRENITEAQDVLIVGERISNGGIIQSVMEYSDYNSITCTDIDPVAEDSNLSRILDENENVSFVQGDFISLDFDSQFDHVVCISVLEHFGMNFAEHESFEKLLDTDSDDYIRWNHDLRCLQKMMDIGDNIIVTVPVGQPIMFGDMNADSIPMLRRYDQRRYRFISSMVQQNGFDIHSNFYFSQDFEEWYETDEEIFDLKHMHLCNPWTPNIIWAFTLERR